MEEFILEENKSRCDFFKYFSYDPADQRGVVSKSAIEAAIIIIDLLSLFLIALKSELRTFKFSPWP